MSKPHIATFNAMVILVIMALSWLPVGASPRGRMAVSSPEPATSDSLTISLITCYPGPEIYELYGHEAIRVRGEGIDSVWNYGVFNFREPNFIYRFVKGETDYYCVGYPFAWFLPEYVERGSKVVEQDLNLTPDEVRRLLTLLQTEALPQNSRYRYNYVKDNCATRILDRIDEATEPRVIYSDSTYYGTFRNEMRSYNRNYPWYQFGIDLALGSGIDYDLSGREEMFVPLEMMKKASGARLADGRPLIKSTRTLYEGQGDVTLPPTPWWQTPLFWSWVLLIVIAAVCLYDLRRKQITKWVFSLWFLIIGLAGCLIAFLVFVSSHEATSPNVLLIWLNPLQLIAGLCTWSKKLRPVTVAIAWYNIVAMICMLLVWPFLNQSANPAFFPLMGVTLLLSGTYAIIFHKESYNNNGAFLTLKEARNVRKGTSSRAKTVKKTRKK